MGAFNKESKKGEAKYSKLLNNLLDIRGRDQTIFTRVNNTDSFDLTSKFGISVSNKIINQDTFSQKLKEQDLESLFSITKSSDDANEIISAYDDANERLFNTKKILLRDKDHFKEVKKELLEKLKLKIQKTKTRWNQFRRKALDINIQDNIWPLHVATLFVSIRTERRELYAPLLLKEVSIDVNGSDVSIKSVGSWKLNEKLIFLLNDSGFSIDDTIVSEDKNLSEILEILSNTLGIEVDDEFLVQNFHNIKTSEVKNKQMNIHSGMVLGIFKPSGGNLRKTMLKIIENDEMDDIINVEPDRLINATQEFLNYTGYDVEDAFQDEEFRPEGETFAPLRAKTVIILVF